MTLLSVFLLGLLGGLHCAGMCGGLLTAMTFRPPARNGAAVIEIAAPRVDAKPLFINLGRISTYTLLGAIAGGVGSTAWVLNNMLPVQRSLFFVSSVLMILIGGWLLGWRGPLSWTETLGHRFWKKLQPLAARRFSARKPLELMLAGGVWGLVPCGMVYMVLLAALSVGNPLEGGLLMAVFGLGTLPNLLLIGAGSQWLGRLGGATLIRNAIAVMVIAMGCVGIYRAFSAQPLDPSIFCLVPGGS
ncbi:MAG: sulfite exporter TauE/SafE family protein [Burkholderiaceae bacterium]